MSDGVVFVTKFNKIRREHARKSIQRLQDAGIHIVGIVLNDIDFEGKDSYYYSYYYYQNRYYASHYRTTPTKPKRTEAKDKTRSRWSRSGTGTRQVPGQKEPQLALVLAGQCGLSGEDRVLQRVVAGAAGFATGLGRPPQLKDFLGRLRVAQRLANTSSTVTCASSVFQAS